MEETYIKTSQDMKLKSFIYGVENKKTAIILCHGFTGSSSQIFMPKLAEKLSQKYLICRFDFRGQGESDGKFYDSSITLEIEDLEHVVKYIKEKYKPTNVILIGHNFGAAIAIFYAARHTIQGLISLSGQGDLKTSIDYEFTKEQLQNLETKGETKVVNYSKNAELDLLSMQFLKDMKRYSTPQASKLVKCPTFFIHGLKNDVIPHTATEKIFQLVKGPKKVKYMPDTDHTYNFFEKDSKVDDMLGYVYDWLSKKF